MTKQPAPGPEEQGAADPRGTLRATAESLLAGTGLEIRELPHDLLITNPRNPEKGLVYIAIPDGHAAWKHTVWDHFGSLTDPEPGAAAADITGKIITALTGTTPSRM